ncbi:hypothetical protein EDD85DRAFT_796508 [Armillaria nabsnona]|nr:hypothetical protein EDD85DRAFT_796508 [Armillaria nabsnona]
MIARTYPGTNILDLTDSKIKYIFHDLDNQFNQMMLQAVTHASRNNFQSPGRPRCLIFIILFLYLLATFGLYNAWTLEIAYTTLPNGKCFWTAYGAVGLSGGGHGALCLLRLLALPWQQAPNVNVASRGIGTYCATFGSLENTSPQALYLENVVKWDVLYSSLILTTFLWCTILIVYRIMRVGGAAGRMHVYQRVVEMLVESASLYSAVLVVLVVLEARNERAAGYIEVVAVATRGIMPTILFGRVAAGHARPDDSWSENITTSSLQFRSQQSVSLAGSESGRSMRITPDLENVLDTL